MVFLVDVLGCAPAPAALCFGTTNWRALELLFQRLFEIYVPMLQGPGTCDHNAAERVINIVTSLPFFALGWQAYRCLSSSIDAFWKTCQ